MLIREKLGERPAIGIGLAVVLIVVAIGVIGYQLFGSGNSAVGIAAKAFYTDDNGKTFFKDDAFKIVPFDHNGKQAYRADVFKGDDGKEFVGLMYRHTPVGKNQMQSYISNKSWKTDREGTLLRGIEQRGMQVKPVGADEKAWAPNDDGLAERLQSQMKTSSGAVAKLVTP
jgi:hypothetical protein